MNRRRRWGAAVALIVSVFVASCVFLPRDPAIVDVRSTDYIDLHVHTAGLGQRGSGAFINEAMRESFRYPIYLRAFGVTEDDLAEHGDAYLVAAIAALIADSKRVAQAVVLAMDGVVRGGRLIEEATQIYVPNAFVAAATARHPELRFGASVNPNRYDAIERLRAAHAAGAVLVKWLPNIMHIDPADRAFEPFYRELIRLDLPLLTHAGQERSFAGANDAYGDPARLHLPLSLGVRVIAAHIATTGETDGEGNFERLLPMFAAYPNLFADISSLTQVNKLGFLRRAMQHPEIFDQLVFGSDWPLQFFPLVSSYYHANNIGFLRARSIAAIDNVFDRDVALKEAYGVPEAIFHRGRTIIAAGREDESR